MVFPELNAQVCPALGLNNDSGSSCSYPSKANHCFHTTPVTAIKLDYQRKVCLLEVHTECELFHGAAGRSRKHFSGALHPSWRHSSAWRVFLLGLVLFLGAVAGFIWLVLYGPGGVPTPPPRFDPEIPVTGLNEITSTPQHTASPSPSITVVVLTPTLLALHALDVPIGTFNQLVIHRVDDGESLDYLARLFNTTPEAIIAINYDLSMPIWPHSVIVVPRNHANFTDLPQFEPYQVLEQVSLKDLAADLSADIEMLMVYNRVDSEVVFAAGDWVLIPH